MKFNLPQPAPKPPIDTTVRLGNVYPCKGGGKTHYWIVVAQIMGHKPSATAEKHYTERPLDLLRVHHDAIETWVLAQAGIVHKPREKRMLAIAK